jgi:hypothetical protein
VLSIARNRIAFVQLCTHPPPFSFSSLSHFFAVGLPSVSSGGIAYTVFHPVVITL